MHYQTSVYTMHYQTSVYTIALSDQCVYNRLSDQCVYNRLSDQCVYNSSAVLSDQCVYYNRPFEASSVTLRTLEPHHERMVFASLPGFCKLLRRSPMSGTFTDYSKIGCRRTHVLRGQAGRSYLQAAFLSRSYIVQCRMKWAKVLQNSEVLRSGWNVLVISG